MKEALEESGPGHHVLEEGEWSGQQVGDGGYIVCVEGWPWPSCSGRGRMEWPAGSIWRMSCM